jgi:hypothetical protein
MTLRWRKDPRETGLRAVGAGPRGSGLYENKIKKFAHVSPLGGDWMRPLAGWYWVAGWDSDVPHRNTYRTPCETEDEAKAEAFAYVQQHLKEKKQ